MTSSTSNKTKYFVVGALALGASLLVIQNRKNQSPTSDPNFDPPVLPSTDHSHRRLSLALPNGGCQITWPKPPPPNIQITYAASYPGCGARMTWNLVEALTGLQTGDDWNNNGRGDKVVTVKTHYPQSNGILPEFDDKINRAFLVVRNPMQSIPSFFNHIYEMRNHLPVHSERAPLEEWIKWRDHYLEEEIREYKKFTVYWMDRMTPENRYVITYEGLTDDLIGAEVTKGLNEFLGRAEGVEAIDRESVPCVWKAVVKNQPPEHQKEQIAKLEQAKAGSESELGGKVKAAAPVPSNAAPAAGNAAPAGDSLGAAPNVYNAAPAMEMTAVAPADAVTNQFNQVGEKIVWNGDEKSLQTIYLDQTQQQLQQLQGIGLQMPPAESQQGYQPMPADQSQMQYQQPQQMIPVEGQFQQYQQPQMQQQQYPIYPEFQQQQQSQQMQYGSGNLRHRRLDPGHHDSQRKGPNVPRPYTQKQLELMMLMLKELGDRYSDDVRLSNIMKGYYEKVEKARNELAAGGGNGGKEMPAAPDGGFY
ncbi:hypothetical protein ACHAXN_008521 [Cyclotella atomus]